MGNARVLSTHFPGYTLCTRPGSQINKDTCPVCDKDDLLPLAWLNTGWPFYTTCIDCGAKLRAKAQPIFKFIARPPDFAPVVVSILKSVSGANWWTVAGIVPGLILYALPCDIGGP